MAVAEDKIEDKMSKKKNQAFYIHLVKGGNRVFVATVENLMEKKTLHKHRFSILRATLSSRVCFLLRGC